MIKIVVTLAIFASATIAQDIATTAMPIFVNNTGAPQMPVDSVTMNPLISVRPISISMPMVGRWNPRKDCTSPLQSVTVFGLLGKIWDTISGLLNGCNINNWDLIVAQTQIVAGQNYAAIFQNNSNNQTSYLGIRVYVGFDKSYQLNGFVFGYSLPQIFSGLGIPQAPAAVIQCPKPQWNAYFGPSPLNFGIGNNLAFSVNQNAMGGYHYGW